MIESRASRRCCISNIVLVSPTGGSVPNGLLKAEPKTRPDSGGQMPALAMGKGLSFRHQHQDDHDSLIVAARRPSFHIVKLLILVISLRVCESLHGDPCELA